MNIEAIIRQYITQVVHMSLATTQGNKPWVCEVHFAYDDDLNLYFRSLPSTRHCQEISANPSVAGNIVTQHHLNQAIRGVYFEGTAKQLSNVDENHPAYQAISQRFALGSEIIEQAKTPGDVQFYQIEVSDWYLFDRYNPATAGKHHLTWGDRGSV